MTADNFGAGRRPSVIVPFESIRRITGYLVGTMEKWNNAKRSEERDRVKHSLVSGGTNGRPYRNL